MLRTNITLPGYEVGALLSHGRKTLIYRGTRLLDNRPVIIKIPAGSAAPLSATNRFRNEFNIGSQFDSEFIIKYYSLESYHNSLAIISEDCGGVKLSALIPDAGLGVPEFLDIALRIIEGLSVIHGKGVIYKDLKPSNIAVCARSNTIKYIDFGISALSGVETAAGSHMEEFEGTLDYISPEQTGRTNRWVDYRTDFYSLGITLYQLLCGRVPFQFKDPLELIHSHIARVPASPSHVRSGVPPAISDIIMKLLEKNAEDRYQSLAGVKADFERCRREVAAGESLPAFEAGKSDFSDKFQISQKIYGREAEIQQLLTVFKRARAGMAEVLLIGGYAGVGKSAVVGELQRPVASQRGFFISGKFDPLNRSAAYSAISQAFQTLAHQLLGESEERIGEWKKRLLASFGVNGQIITSVIPAIEMIVGKQPPAQNLGPVEARNHFERIFARFVRVFTQEDHPLVLFLDDLQNADIASLKLFKYLATDAELQHCMLIGSFRDNEVDALHPARVIINEIEAARGSVEKVFLPPLDASSTSQLVADTLRCGDAVSQPLAEEIYRKTGGNAFFVKLFLQTIYNDRLLSFVPAQGWQWDMERIKTMPATENVAGLMLRRLRGLPAGARAVLKLAACFGNAFPLETIAMVSGKSSAEILDEIQPALSIGILIQEKDGFRFIHDRVQEAAYSLIPESEKQAFHYHIGNILSGHLTGDPDERQILSVANHLNAARNLIPHDARRVKTAQLNLQAAQQLMKSAAHATALPYFAAGIECLPPDAWEANFELAYALYRGCSEAEYLNGNFAASCAHVDLLLRKARTAMDQAELFSFLIYQYTVAGDYAKSIETGKNALKPLGINLPEGDLGAALAGEIERARDSLGSRPVASLIDSPEMQSPEHRAAMRLLMEMQPAAYMFSPPLYNVLTVMMANISLQYGHTRESAKAYVTYANILSSVMQEYRLGLEFYQLGARMGEDRKDLVLQCRGNFIYIAFLVHWTKHFKEGESALWDGYQTGIECGDFQYAGYMIGFGASNLFNRGTPLDRLAATLRKHMAFVKKIRHQMPIDTLQGFLLAIDNLRGETSGRLSFDTAESTEEEFLGSCRTRTITAYCFFMVIKAQTLYLYGSYQAALACIHEAGRLIDYIRGASSYAECNFYHSLILAALYPAQDSKTQQAYLAQIGKNQEQMQNWARHCADNFLHKYLLVEAEKARITGDDIAAIKSYDLAAASAIKNDFIHGEALANELAARFWFAFGKNDVAHAYLDNARQRYRHWGARAKAAEIEERYALAPAPDKARKSTSTGSAMSAIDFASITKASQAISGEIVLEKLLEKTMSIVIENAGAQRGFLITREGERLVIAAEASVGDDREPVLRSTPLDESQNLSRAVVHYVHRSRESVVLGDAVNEGLFTQDLYVATHRPKSIICMPIIKQGELLAILYLENNLAHDAFTPERLHTLSLLAGQIAVSIENARLYQNIEQEVALRTRQLQEKTELLNNLNASLTETGKALERSNAELQSFASIASHDLQEPLRKILTFGSQLQERLKATDAQSADYAWRMQSAAARMQRLVEDLLQYSQVSTQARPFEPVDLRQTMKDVIDFLEDRIRRTSGTVNTKNLPTVNADPLHMQQLLQNLVGNALKYHRQGAPPVVNVEGVKNASGAWEISIADNGIGFDEKYCERIFKPFERLHGKNSYEGTGIGLAICKKIIDRHHGSIKVKSRIGEGSTFTIILPGSPPGK